VLLVVQDDNAIITDRNPEAQVIAEAIAAFQLNNNTRGQLGQPLLDSMVIPCITMTYTRPIFYLVPVTQELSQAVAFGLFPPNPTVVKRCVASPKSGRIFDGMETPDFRQLALRHFIAFRTVAETHWSAFMIPAGIA